MPFSPSWNYSSTTPLTAEEQRRSWGLVVHLNPILDLVHLRLPKGLDISYTYNDSNSFRPSDVGTDIYGRSLAAPSGITRDRFPHYALDEKVSLRMTWYKTIQKNTSLADPSVWFLGQGRRRPYHERYGYEAWVPPPEPPTRPRLSGW